MYRETKLMTAVVLTAVIFIGSFSGCCTKRDVEAINNRIANLEAQSTVTKDLVSNMEALVTESTEGNRQLQNDVRSSNDQLAEQLNQLLENYNDLMTRLERVSQPVIKLPPTSSPGATPDDPAVDEEPPPGVTPATDCIDTYDSAFTLVRRSEYPTAIDGFRRYLADCGDQPDAENAYYWVGECYYAQEKYTEAVAEYQHLVTTYPNSANLGRAIYKLARCQQELGNSSDARELFQQLVDDYAGTLEADQASERLKDL